MDNQSQEQAAVPNEPSLKVYHDDDADIRLGFAFEDRYGYDLELTTANGWHQFDTRQDAWYFGLWIDVISFRTFCYCEGDRVLRIYATLEDFKEGLDELNTVYGAPPPAIVAFGGDNLERTDYYDIRPSSTTYEHLLAKTNELRMNTNPVDQSLSTAPTLDTHENN